MPDVLTDTQLRQIEEAHAEGFSSSELVAAFLDRDVHFTEANLRRYVQLGLVPRSRRVSTSGRAQGSRGLYPLRALRRINQIKSLMGEQRYTLEEIQTRYLTFQDGMETVEESLEDLFERFEKKILEIPEGSHAALLRRELAQVRRMSVDLSSALSQLEQVFQRVCDQARPRRGGAASATELL